MRARQATTAAALGLIALLFGFAAWHTWHGAGRPGPVAKAPDEIEIARDLRYGPAPLERLDVYHPASSGAVRPVIVFVHGGAYQFGDKDEAGGRWRPMARFFVRHGFVFVNADYRLAPAATWPAGLQDVGAVVAWLHAHAAAYGGNPARIVLLGHSAGATHVAGYVFDRRFQPDGGPGVIGAILVSGRYRLAVDKRDPNNGRMRSYFGGDPAAWPDREPLAHAASAPHLRLLIATAERENPDLADAAAALEARLHASSEAPEVSVVTVRGEGHVSEMTAIGVRRDALADEMLGFLHGLGAGA